MVSECQFRCFSNLFASAFSNHIDWRSPLFRFLKPRTPSDEFQRIADHLRGRYRNTRSKAYEEIKLHYPDASILISGNSTNLIAVSSSRKSIIVGEFFDFPKFDYSRTLDGDEETASYVAHLNEEIRQFDQDMANGYFSFLSPYLAPYRHDAIGDLHFKRVKKGYDYSVYDSRRLTNCELFFDECQVWAMGVDHNGDKDSLRSVIEKRWYQSSEFSSRSSFQITIQIDLNGFGSCHARSWETLFLGGPQLTGRAKAEFSNLVIESLVSFIDDLPVWSGSLDEWWDRADSVEFHDGFDM